MLWNFRKPLKQNFINNNLKFICPRGNFFEPWKNEQLNKYLTYDIFDGKRFLSLFVDDEDICPYLRPDNPSGVYFQTNILSEETEIKLQVQITEYINTKLVTLREESDVLNKDVVSIVFEDYKIHVKHRGLSKLILQYYEDDIVELGISVKQNHIYVTVNDYHINFDDTIEDDYWYCFGMVNTPIKTYNNLRLYSYELH